MVSANRYSQVDYPQKHPILPCSLPTLFPLPFPESLHNFLFSCFLAIFQPAYIHLLSSSASPLSCWLSYAVSFWWSSLSLSPVSPFPSRKNNPFPDCFRPLSQPCVMVMIYRNQAWKARKYYGGCLAIIKMVKLRVTFFS